MRINEFKQKNRIDEIGRLTNFFGNATTAAKLKQFANRYLPGGDRIEGQMSVTDKAAKENFMSSFYSAAMKSLGSEIASGRVDPNIKSTTTPSASPAAPPTASPATAPGGAPAAAGTKKVAPGNAAAPGQSQRQTSQNINNYVKQVAAAINKAPDKGQKMALAKELVNFMADRKNYPEWQNAVATVQNVIKRGVPDPNFANSAANRLKAGQMMEAWQAYWINKLLENIGFTFEDLGYTLLKENKKNGKYILAETKYYKMNMIFETMLTEAESVEQWFKRFLPMYLKGIPISDPTTQALIKSTADAYNPKNLSNFQKEFTKLANAIYASALAPGYGAGAEASGEPATGDTPAATKPLNSPLATPQAPDQILNSIQSLLTKLKGVDPALHKDIIQRIGAGKSLQNLPESLQKRRIK